MAARLQGRVRRAMESDGFGRRGIGPLQSPACGALDPEGRLRLLNAAGERGSGARVQSTGYSANTVEVEERLHVGDDEGISIKQRTVSRCGGGDSERAFGCGLYSAYDAGAFGCECGVTGRGEACVGEIDSRVGHEITNFR